MDMNKRPSGAIDRGRAHTKHMTISSARFYARITLNRPCQTSGDLLSLTYGAAMAIDRRARDSRTRQYRER